MNTFCRIFVYYEKNNINDIIKLLYKKDNIGRYFQLDKFTLAIVKNDLFNDIESKKFPDGFLYFPYSFEIEFEGDINIEYAIYNTERLLIYCWHNNIPAVAACDYEHLLKYNGGYKSFSIPWPK